MTQGYDQLIQSYRNKVTGLLDELQTRFAELDRYVAEIESLQTKVQNYKQDFTSALLHVQSIPEVAPKSLAERMNGIVSEAPLPDSPAMSMSPEVETAEQKDEQFGSLKGIIGADD